ncbi:uncharacterized protein BP5553_08106 [Venustampulla echinocandica]|uniref:Uncharacterized protein n=1 Tax=Venustampulla echinocandica TaxID=2656787 RepID=A0A370TFR2_9HELO|nr:uncharacterized protein BP5553_08106 [Venustampulla echinocandica]RDL33738.1 hypothetical protein BP5553_08106 [Venustampulla echinocandica]
MSFSDDNAALRRYISLIIRPRTRSNVQKLSELRPDLNILHPPMERDPLYPPRQTPLLPYIPGDLFDMGSNYSQASSLDIGDGEPVEEGRVSKTYDGSNPRGGDPIFKRRGSGRFSVGGEAEAFIPETNGGVGESQEGEEVEEEQGFEEEAGREWEVEGGGNGADI